MEKGTTETQIAVMAEQIRGIQKEMITLNKQISGLSDDLRIGFNDLNERYTPKGEVEDIKRRVESVESWQTWAMRAVIGAVVTAVIGAVILVA